MKGGGSGWCRVAGMNSFSLFSAFGAADLIM